MPRHWPGVALSMLALPAGAADLGTLGGFDVRVDTGIRLSFGVRTDRQDASLLAPINADDGDRAFRRGPISERADGTTTLDLSRGDLGAEISADGWYDAAYHGRNDDTSPGTFNPVTTPPGRFPADVRRLMGGAIELGNAYVRDVFEALGLPISVRLGRQTLLWGESLFFARDGIAGAQAPVDLVKIASQPSIEARETYLPVTQAVVRVQLNRSLSFEAYDQFEWRRDRTPGVASYFSTSDILDTGGQRVLLGQGGTLFRARDTTPSGIGQFGAAFRYDSGSSSLGLYALRYDAKLPAAEQGAKGTYRLVFPRGIELFGLSASCYVGEDTLSGEVSLRRRLPLASLFSPFAPTPPSAADPVQPGFATGRTLQALASYDRLFSPGRVWDGAELLAELSVTDLLGIESQSGAILPRSTRFSSALQAVFTPTYYHLLPGLRLAVPMGVEIGLAGRSTVDAGQDAGVGNLTVGVRATYRTVWQLGLSLTRYIGPARLQPLADRGFATASLARTF